MRRAAGALTGLVACLAGAASAQAADPVGGGLSAPENPRIDAVTCGVTGAVCRRGGALIVTGSGLGDTGGVVFLGGSGSGDDRRARPQAEAAGRLVVTVPLDARTGPIKVVTSGMGEARSTGSVRVAAAVASGGVPISATANDLAAPVPSVFPIRGKYTVGRTAANHFGGVRGHQGQDVLAACGTPLVAPEAVLVSEVGTQGAAGNFVVFENAAGGSYVFMHLAARATVEEGETLTAGEAVGVVGRTGRASACHLHVEQWTAPGWQRGRPVDPLPQLKSWGARL